MLNQLNKDGRLEPPSRYQAGDTVYHKHLEYKVIRPSQFLKGVICNVLQQAVYFDDKDLSDTPLPLSTFTSELNAK